jgi:CDP-paratose synthetase
VRILLTGSTGFLGSALTRHWVDRGHELCLLIRHSSNTHRVEEFLDQVDVVREVNLEKVKNAVIQYAPDVIVHTACSYGRVGESPIELLDANVRLGIALLQAAVDGSGPRTQFVNTGTVLAPSVSLYALSKHQFSQWGSALCRQYPLRLQFVEVLLQQMYGAGDDRTKFIANVIESCRLNEPDLKLTPGEQLRDFIHIDDVVSAFDAIITHSSLIANYEQIDVGSGDAISMKSFVKLAHQIAQSKTELKFGVMPYRPAEPMHCVADPSRLRSLGWIPRFDLESGLNQTILHHKKLGI